VSIVRLCCRTSLQNFSNIPLIVLQEEDIWWRSCSLGKIDIQAL
jgi:hypothetical protein